MVANQIIFAVPVEDNQIRSVHFDYSMLGVFRTESFMDCPEMHGLGNLIIPKEMNSFNVFHHFMPALFDRFRSFLK